MAEEYATPEAAGEYLVRTNFKALVEWLTAEAILHRPGDPLAFLRDVCTLKISEREADAKYDPEDATRYVQACYNDAANTADEHGRIRAATSDDDDDDKIATSAQAPRALEAALSVVEALDDPQAIRERLEGACCDLLGAERGGFLEGRGKRGLPQAKLYETVYESGATCNLSDAQNDARFDRSADKNSGLPLTRNLVCCAMRRNNVDETIGVAYAANKLAADAFTRADEETLARLGTFAAHSLKLARDLHATARRQTRADRALDLLKDATQLATTSEEPWQQVGRLLEAKLPEIVDCETCTVFEVCDAGRKLKRRDFESLLSEDLVGLAAACARERSLIHVPDQADTDPRFSEVLDRTTEKTVESILCLPVLLQSGQDGASTMSAVVHLANKRGTSGRDNFGTCPDDIPLLEALLAIIARVLRGGACPVVGDDAWKGAPPDDGGEKAASRQDDDAKVGPGELQQPSLVEEYDEEETEHDFR